MSPAAHFDALAGGLGRSPRRRRLAYGVRQGFQVIGRSRVFLRLADGEPNDIPAPRCGHPVGVTRAQVVAMGLDEGRQRPENSRGVPVHVGKRVQGSLLAGRPGALARAQRTTSGWHWHPARRGGGRLEMAGSRSSLTTADGIDRQAVTPPPGAHCAIVSPPGTLWPPGRLTAAGIRSVTVHDGKSGSPARTGRLHRRDRHGRGLRGSLVPPDVPLHRTRAERFDDLVLLAVSQLEPRWEAELSGIEFAVEEIPPAGPDLDDSDPVPLARLEIPASPVSTTQPTSPEPPFGPAPPPSPAFELSSALPPVPPASPRHRAASGQDRAVPATAMARADGEEELAELVLDVVVEQFAHWLGVDPQTIDPGYPGDE